MFTCLNNRKSAHQHATVTEARICWGLLPDPKPAIPVYHDPKDRPGSMTPRQRKYLKSLGASEADLHYNGRELSINQASHLIDTLKKGQAMSTTQQQSSEDPRIAMLKGLMDLVPDGYYAVRPDDSVNYSFIRISSPKTGHYKGARKVQTQHSDDLHDRLIIWPSGRWTVKSSSILDDMMLLVADQAGCAMAYADEIGKCCRCNKALTDARSRHYGIGPDCEQVWPHIIELRDEANGGPFVG